MSTDYAQKYEKYLKLLDEYFTKYDQKKYEDPFCEISDNIEFVINLIENSKGKRVEPILSDRGEAIEYKYID